ncbi:MAG TPA: LPS export ABC transporter permease LptF [Paenalcaligenes sp.]|nr:LPS export ABC transporter permease LptF [Paenalcaligenes sp.]
MSLFRRSVVSEILSHGGVVLSTLIVVWLSVLLVRLLGDAASGRIGAEVVLGLAVFSSITALPVILAVSLFIAVLTTVSRSYRESEMVVWFSSGLSLSHWIRPVLYCALPVALIVAALTFYGAPWAYRQIAEYHQRYELRSDLSRVSTGEFIETEGGERVFFSEEPISDDDDLGQVVVRIEGEEWLHVITAQSAHTEIMDNNDRFLVLHDGHRYDLHPGAGDMRLFKFDRYGVRMENRDEDTNPEAIRAQAQRQLKARTTERLVQSFDEGSQAHLMWRLAMPLAALNLALLAIPLGAVNPRLGRSGDVLVAGLLALLYMNLINLSRGWINKGTLPFELGLWLVHALFAGLMVFLLWQRLRVKKPKEE